MTDTTAIAGDGRTASQVDERRLANALRALAMDAVEQANSGHPGMPMGMADVATVLFREFLTFDAADPRWPDRDRFVLSAGHGSMLLYGLGHLLGYADLPLEQLKAFRQLGSRTAGHPEWGHVALAETTTGPLGQGLANAVGMAIAEAHLRARFGAELVDHRTYVIAGDGCLMEGVSQEAITLAGHLKLNRLVVLWDDNAISIDGPVSLSDSTDQRARFEASGWATRAVDGHDPDAVREALTWAQTAERPVLIACRTTIGFGAPNKGATAAAHGAPLGAEEVAAARQALDWPHPPFEIPEDIQAVWSAAGARGRPVREAWDARVAAHPQAEAFRGALAAELSGPARAALAAAKTKALAAPAKMATRKASGVALDAVAPALPELIGGSADLTGSNNTKASGLSLLTADDYAGRYIHYGVREHAMAAAMNGMALHGGVIPYGGTFLVFSDYCRPSIRLAALMGVRSIFVMTHDSIGVGEDGPTHQPVEHVASLRAIPGLNVFRPADVVEALECWELALEAERPSVLALSRQGVPQIRTEPRDGNACARGGYILSDSAAPDVTLIASGTEASLAVAAAEMLAREGVACRVVSMPCLDLFDAQSAAYQDETLGSAPLRVVVEAGVRQGWDRWLRRGDRFVGMSGFGASGPGADVFAHFGLTADAVAAAVREARAGDGSRR